MRVRLDSGYLFLIACLVGQADTSLSKKPAVWVSELVYASLSSNGNSTRRDSYEISVDLSKVLILKPFRNFRQSLSRSNPSSHLSIRDTSTCSRSLPLLSSDVVSRKLSRPAYNPRVLLRNTRIYLNALLPLSHCRTISSTFPLSFVLSTSHSGIMITPSCLGQRCS